MSDGPVKSTGRYPRKLHPLPLRIMCGLLGVPFQDREKFARWTSRTPSVAALPVSENRPYGSVAYHLA